MKVHELHKLHKGGMFSRKYRSTRHLTARGKRNIDQKLRVIPAEFSEFCALGTESLATLLNSVKASDRLRQMPELTLHQDAEDAVVFVFHAPDLDKISKIVGAKRKRHVSSEHMRKIGSATAYK